MEALDKKCWGGFREVAACVDGITVFLEGYGSGCNKNV